MDLTSFMSQRRTQKGDFSTESRGAWMMVSFEDRVESPPHVLVRFLNKESVLLNLETERYFGLDETGTRMWQLVTASPNIDAAYRELQNEFDVEAEVLRSHLTELLGRLVENGLLQIQPADVGRITPV
ncbi:MAG TPA: PqqD family protein [Candidatus Acidoferrum sp.]|nr:PqqD family protein [Candidatus Acidoferrum sp.]